jgi:hypothetical protein
MAIMWPEPVSAKKPMPDRVPAAPVQVTVHSIFKSSVMGKAVSAPPQYKRRY